MQMIIGLIAFFFMLSAIVVIHELGHFLVAKHFGVYCHEFSIGMGPVLYQHQGKETMFSIRAIPFGGYVMMAGEEDGSQEEDTEWLQNVPSEKRLNHKKTWQQICVMVAGVCMNIILAWALFVGLAMAKGYEILPSQPIVAQMEENGFMSQAGLQVGDEILEIQASKESLEPKTNDEVVEFIQYHHDDVTLKVQRENDIQMIGPVTFPYNEELGGYLPGYKVQGNFRYTKWYEAFRIGSQELVANTTMIFRSLANLFSGVGLENLSGPVGIYQVTAKTAQMGFDAYLSLFAMISLNIGIFNLIPIPALDGGRILILGFERLFRRKINTKLVEKIITVSFILLIGLFIFATYNDIVRLF